MKAVQNMITLPYPPKELSPNARIHWAKKSKVTKACRTHAGWETKAAGVKVDWDGDIHVHISFFHPDARRRDEDNCIARCKAYLDGIADALGVNDNRFKVHPFFGNVKKGGEVRVIISEHLSAGG